MAEMLCSTVVQGTVSQIISSLFHCYEGKQILNSNENLERLEMAHIKLEAALETSSRFQITDASLLRWRKKLKLAAQECDDTLHKCKQRVVEEEQEEQEVRNSIFPRRIAHATKSIIFSAISHNDKELDSSIVRRFEWFADGASEFIRFVELGGTPRRHMPFTSIIHHLFEGKELQHNIFRGNEYPSIMLSLAPFSTAEHGVEACLKIIQKDGNAPENNFFLGVMLQISESTDIVGVIVKCLQLFPTHFQHIVQSIKKQLIQLPTQDFSWVPYIDLWHRKHWDNLHSISTQWFRPDPLCCKQNDQHKDHLGNIDMVGLPNVSLDSVIKIHLQCQVSMSKYNKQQTSLSICKNYMQDSQYLKAGILFTPHSSKVMLPTDRSSAISAICGEEQHCVDTDITLEQLNETMLPKAIDDFCQNSEATIYQMLWKSKHGTEYIDLEKASMEMPSAGRTYREARKRKQAHQEAQELGSRNGMVGQELWSWNHLVARFINLWVAEAPIRLQGLMLDWNKKEKKSQLAAEPTIRSRRQPKLFSSVRDKGISERY